MYLRHVSLVAGLSLSLCAQAQTPAPVQPEIEFYGLLDLSVRESDNQNAAGQSKLELTDGVLTGSRIGVRGRHPIGDMAAVYTAEAGFSPDTGTSLQGGRLFGRQLFAGLDGNFGTLIGGRQYTVAHNTLARYEAFAFANTPVLGYQGGNYTGLRYDNEVKYLKSVGALQFQYAHSFGNVAGSMNQGSSDGAAVNYDAGPLSAGLVYQKTHTVSSAYFNAVTAANASTQDVWGGGFTYQAGPAKLYFGYTNSKLALPADYKNSVYFVSTNYQATSALQLLATVQADKLDHAGVGGNRLTSGVMADYYLDKRTDVYVEADYTKLKGGWIPLANNTALGNGDLYGFDSRTGFSVGGRLKF